MTNWMLSQRDLNIKVGTLQQQHPDFFRDVVNFGCEMGDNVFVFEQMTPTQLSGGNYQNVAFDFGYMRLPKDTILVDYQITNGALAKLDYGINRPKLSSAFFGKVLFDLQPTKNSSPYLPERSNGNPVPFDLCTAHNNWQPLGGRHGCPRLLNCNSITTGNQITTGFDIPLFYYKGSEPDSVGYFLIPLLMPEKTVVYYAIVDDQMHEKYIGDFFRSIENNYNVLSKRTDSFLIAEFKKGILRDDNLSISYVVGSYSNKANISLVAMNHDSNLGPSLIY
jgi:hypothetical protein